MAIFYTLVREDEYGTIVRVPLQADNREHAWEKLRAQMKKPYM